MRVPPCKDCPNRGCGSYHDKCREYQEYKREREKIAKAKRRESFADGFRTDMIYKTKRGLK